MYPSWKEYLLRMGRLDSMCLENIEALRSCQTKEEAISLYKKTADWALEKNYPSIEFIRKEFCGYESEGLFIDKVFHGALLNDHQCYVFHNCSGHIAVDINIEKRIIPMLYFANGCNLCVTRAESPQSLSIKVPLYIYGDNTITAKDTDNITFTRKGGAR